MKTNNLQNKIQRTIWSITIALTLLLLVIICFFLSSSQWNRTVSSAKTALQSSTNQMNIQLNILTKYNEIIVGNPLIYKYFSEEYPTTQAAVNATFSINDYFQTFYNSYDGGNTNIYIYHDNHTLSLSSHSRYIEDLEDSLRKRILKLRFNEYLWSNTEDSTVLYGNMTRNAGSQMILAIPLTDASIKTILHLLDQPYAVQLSSTPPENDKHVYLSNRLINGQYISVGIPRSEKYAIYLRNFMLTGLLAALLFTVISILTKKITVKITGNLYEFIDYLMADNQYLLTQKTEIEPDNEFKHLFLKIDQLVSEINKAHNDAEELRRRNSSLQLYHMQYQINPHLLYNALSALKWESMQYGEMIPNKIDALADYYRLSLTQSTEGYNFQSEVIMLKKYIELLSLIHNFDYQYTIELDAAILSTATIPHILQPFAENAILHGINQKEGGFIRIAGHITEKMEDKYIEITLEDNGYGISPEKLKQLTSINYESSRSSGLGVRNTISRIRLYYGPNSTVNISSKENRGTTVLLTFPYVAD